MNKTQVIKVTSELRSNNYTNSLDELKIVLRLLEEIPLRDEYPVINTFISHLRGIISLQNEKLNERTQYQFQELYGIYGN